MCGAKCTSYAESELWTLNPSGFGRGGRLPGTYEMPGGLTYGSSSSLTSLHWVEVVGSEGPAIAVKHSDSQLEGPKYGLFTLNPEKTAYTERNVLVDVPPEEYGAPTYGTGFASF